MKIDPRIAAATETLSQSSTLEGLFIAGSHGRGTADAYSDIDLVALAEADTHAALAKDWRAALDQQTEIVFWQVLPRGGLLANAITRDWLRVDLIIVPKGSFGRRAQSTVRPVFDPHALWDALPVDLPDATPSRARVEALTREFLRVLGLIPVALGRGELVLGVRGAGMLRDMLGDLMTERCVAADRGGMLHPSTLLAEADQAALMALPYPGPDRDAIIAAHIATAQAFLPRAKALMAETGGEWPDAFEAATRAHLAKAGIDLTG